MKNLTRDQINKLQSTTKNLGSLNLAELNLMHLNDTIENADINNSFVEIVGIIIQTRVLDLPMFKGLVIRHSNDGYINILGFDSTSIILTHVEKQRLLTDDTISRDEVVTEITTHHCVFTNNSFTHNINYLQENLIFIKFDNVDFTNPKPSFFILLENYEEESKRHNSSSYFQLISPKYISLYSLIKDFKLNKGEVNFRNGIYSVAHRYDKNMGNIIQNFNKNLPITHDLKAQINIFLKDLILNIVGFINYSNPFNTEIENDLYDKYIQYKIEAKKRRDNLEKTAPTSKENQMFKGKYKYTTLDLPWAPTTNT